MTSVELALQASFNAVNQIRVSDDYATRFKNGSDDNANLYVVHHVACRRTPYRMTSCTLLLVRSVPHSGGPA
jgi:hypothetical protein